LTEQFLQETAPNLAVIGFLKIYGIIVVVLLDGVGFLRKSFRVKKEKDFNAIFKEGESVANRRFVIYRLANSQEHFRVGLSVSKKLGNAVMRNQIKRRIRHILIDHRNELVDNIDFIVIARKGVENLEYAELEKNLLHVLRLAKIYQEGNRSEEENTTN
jgi:ribonuclease P protein component